MAQVNKNLAVHFSSKTDDWETPQALFDELNAKWGPFQLDVCATASNAKCLLYYSEVDDGLLCPWTSYDPPIPAGDDCGTVRMPSYNTAKITVSTVWCNPPYGRQIGKWVKKAYEESLKGCLVCLLLPARTDTSWFHDYCYGNNRASIEFLRGRLKFGDAKNSAPFPSMVAVFRPL